MTRLSTENIFILEWRRLVHRPRYGKLCADKAPHSAFPPAGTKIFTGPKALQQRIQPVGRCCAPADVKRIRDNGWSITTNDPSESRIVERR